MERSVVEGVDIFTSIVFVDGVFQVLLFLKLVGP